MNSKNKKGTKKKKQARIKKKREIFKRIRKDIEHLQV
jgi:hypothetical protein